MKIEVFVKTNAKKEAIEKIGENQYRVWVKAPAQENRANEALITQVAKFFGVPEASVTILLGAKSKRKLIQIDD